MSLELELIWYVVVLGAVLGISWFGGGAVGLSLAYLISLGFIHFWGGFIHALPWYSGGEAEYTLLGFDQFAYAVTAFAIGRCLTSPIISKHFHVAASPAAPAALARTAILVGRSEE